MKFPCLVSDFTAWISFILVFSCMQVGNAFEFKEPAWANVSRSELRGYGTLYAMSDIHGTFERFTTLLIQAKLIEKDNSKLGFNWIADKTGVRKTILILVGDYIGKENDKDYDPIGVVLLIQELKEQAEKKGDKVIALLGNHEAEFLADPAEDFKKGDLKSLKKHVHHVAGISPKDLEDDSEMKKIAKKLLESEFGDDLKTFPIGAKIGSWLFAHSGYMDVGGGDVEAYLSKLTNAWLLKNYDVLVDKKSPRAAFLEAHDWWDEPSNLRQMRSIFKQLKLKRLVIGHDPDGLKKRGEIALSKSEFLIKLDAGMNLEAKDSKGRLLKCPISSVLKIKKTKCMQVDENGEEEPIPVIPGY